MPNKTSDFIKGQIYVMQQRLDKATRRIQRAGDVGNKVEEERAHRLSKLIELHKSNPEEALKLYNTTSYLSSL